MPTTRGQAAASRNASSASAVEKKEPRAKPASRGKKGRRPRKGQVKEEASPVVIGEKREADEEGDPPDVEQPAVKKPKAEEADEAKPDIMVGDAKGAMESKEENEESVVDSKEENKENVEPKDYPAQHMYQTGTIERGHIYFFYRPKVEMEEAHSIDEVQRFHILLVPRPPEFSMSSPEEPPETLEETDQNEELTLLPSGADVVPAPEPTDEKKKFFRLIVVGKKGLPDPEEHGRNRVIWGTIVTVSDDLSKLQEGLSGREYETKTRGLRHQAAARLAARGAYAIVNREARVPSDRETHLGYHLSHPTTEHFGEVQEALGIQHASSLVLQVKNPLAPPTGIGRVGLPRNRTANFPQQIMHEVFGVGGDRGREEFGLRFASVERKEMLDYEGVELLFIAARGGDEGLEKSLGEGRGAALHEVEERESKETIQQVFKELALDSEKIPANPLEGEWI